MKESPLYETALFHTCLIYFTEVSVSLLRRNIQFDSNRFGKTLLLKTALKYRDVSKRDLKSLDNDVPSLETIASDREAYSKTSVSQRGM